jgi:formate hydrogenlyase subunit 6/NADH:ubiquinone oxidoreductase subunit I
MPICPVNCIHPVSEYTVAPEKLEAAKVKAKAFAAKQRRIKLNRDEVVAATLAKLNAGSVSHA